MKKHCNHWRIQKVGDIIFFSFKLMKINRHTEGPGFTRREYYVVNPLDPPLIIAMCVEKFGELPSDIRVYEIITAT